MSKPDRQRRKRPKLRVLSISLGGILVLAGSASNATPDAGAQTRPASQKTPPDAGVPAACGRIGATGCCHGETLVYCDKKQRKLRALDCKKRPRCGWRETGRYDCDTAGSADPAGRYARFCVLPDAGLPIDLGADSKTSACGSVTEEGCCFGDTLHFCQGGLLRQIDCKANRFCGWRGVAQAYNCGTDGKPDPRGKHQRECAGAPDSGALRFPDLRLRDPRSQTPATSGGGCGGCACTIGDDAVGARALIAWLFVLGLVGVRRLGTVRR